MNYGPRPDLIALTNATWSAIISANARITSMDCQRRLPSENTQPLNLSHVGRPVLFCFQYAYDPESPYHAANLTVIEYGPDELPYRRATSEAETSPAMTNPSSPPSRGPASGHWALGVHRITLTDKRGAIARNSPYDVNR